MNQDQANRRIAELEEALSRERSERERLQRKMLDLTAEFTEKTSEQEKTQQEMEVLLNKLEEVIVEYQDKENQLEKERLLLEKANHNLEEKNRELGKINRQLAQLDQLKSSFLSMISHELRTPITVVQGNTEILLDHIEHLSPKQTQVLLNTMFVRLKELIFLVETLLNLASIEAKSFQIFPKWCSLSEIVAKINDQINPLLIKQNIQYTFDSIEAIDQVYLDKNSFKLVLINLLSNAIKFNYENGEVELKAELSPLDDHGAQDLTISVRDTGIGIPSTQRLQIFEKFYQVDNSNTRQYGGSGLGLALAKEIVLMHKGGIWVESELGKGTTFYIKLPQPPAPKTN